MFETPAVDNRKGKDQSASQTHEFFFLNNEMPHVMKSFVTNQQAAKCKVLIAFTI